MKNVRSALKAIRDIFMIRSCNFLIDEESIRKKKFKVCLDYHIKKCEGTLRGPRQPGKIQRDDRPGGLAPPGKNRLPHPHAPGGDGTHAAARRFEEAALIRDRIRGLEAYSERQKAVDLDSTDRDIMAFAADGDDACGVIFKLRDGKMVGRQHYYMGNVEGKPEGEILEALLQQYYLDAEDIPERDLIQTPLDEPGRSPDGWGSAGGTAYPSSPRRRGRRPSSCGSRRAMQSSFSTS